MRNVAVALSLAVAGLTLAACGGTTVDSSDVTATPSAVTSSATSTASTTTSTKPSSEKRPEDDALENEGAASEVSDFPENTAKRPPEQEAYLEALREGGVKIEGNEDQLLATAGTLCGGETITRDAVAGQLIEQQRTELDHEQLIKLIDDAAHANLC
ncbi:hypothetical protein QP994_07380 [Corynebacterium sp. MSK044]|uniref:hypothetical protein n=1 Tax=Corynebacterium sp. MSK044 TaxID=3050195 RepID=UPI002551761E|nr:hypothetical protein [Corynebacterium sp. MSK044]MDK8797703.1 hypothetical protein [Corynebacterium sp. MSK044]